MFSGRKMKRMEEFLQKKLTHFNPCNDVIFQRTDWLGKGRPTVLCFLKTENIFTEHISRLAQVSLQITSFISRAFVG